MAPFKLKFRMGSGSSRSASQEQDVVVDNQANQIVSNYLNSNNLGAGYGSSTTLDSEQNNDSLVSMNNDQRALIRDRDSTDDRLGYINPSLTHTETNTIPLSPPPSYEHVLEENRLAALDKENNKTSTLNLSSSGYEMLRNSQQSLDTSCHEQQQQQYCDHQQTTPNATRKQESIDSSMYSCSSATSPSQENLLGCTGSCDPLYNMANQEPMGELS
ncbi:AAEL015444-PA, partial [Aedes aegypti]